MRIYKNGKYEEVANDFVEKNITAEEESQIMQQEVEDSVQELLDSKAREKGYDSILSACTYASYTNPFQAEGKAFVEWRGNVWAYCYQALGEVMNGTRTEPTIDELLLELPILILPQ